MVDSPLVLTDEGHRLSARAFSLVIPCRNAGRTLADALEAVRASEVRPAETLVVDDGSEDDTTAIAGRFGCRVVACGFRTGPMAPRFAGAAATVSPLLIFIDADVLVYPETFTRMLVAFEDPGVSAVTGTLDGAFRTGTFFGDFKNEYMDFVFGGRGEESSFVYGSVWAVRREAMVTFRPIERPFGSLVSDSETGFRLRAEGHRVRLARDVRVRHMKPYTLVGLLINDFKIPFLFAVMFARYREQRIAAIDGGAFSHASWTQAAGLALALGAVAAAAGAWLEGSRLLWLAAGVAAAGFYGIWAGFLVRLLRRRGGGFALASACLTLPDACVMGIGAVSGFVYALATGADGPR